MMEKVGICVMLLLCSCTVYGHPLHLKQRRDSLIDTGNDGIIEDDIKLTDFDPYDESDAFWVKRSVKERTRPWTNGIVPYHIDINYFSEEELETIRLAIEEFHNKSCIRFVERTTEMPYLVITPLTRCWSEIGMPKEQEAIRTLSLGPSCLDRRGTIIHEFMHILGFWHEQNRSDRDNYIIINWDNIRDGLQHNFYKYGEDKVDTMHEPYDYQSIMHYSSYAFTKDPHKPTIETKIPAMIGQRQQLSEMDIKKLHKMYNCATTTLQPIVDLSSNQLVSSDVSHSGKTEVSSILPFININVPNFASLIPLPFRYNWSNENIL